MNKNIAIAFLIGALLMGGISYYRMVQTPVSGNVITQGIIPFVASESIATVGSTSISTVAAAKTNCASRIISTASTSVQLSFLSSFSPTNGQTGIWQAASTTKEYDNGIYGCGAITGLASASSTVTVVTTIQ